MRGIILLFYILKASSAIPTKPTIFHLEFHELQGEEVPINKQCVIDRTACH